MLLSPGDSRFLYSRAHCFSNSKLHALDHYWSENKSHPMHRQIHVMIETILIRRGEKTLRQERLDLIRNFEKSLSLSTPMGRISANIISYITHHLTSRN